MRFKRSQIDEIRPDHVPQMLEDKNTYFHLETK